MTTVEAAASVANKEFEAGLSLLHMMQRSSDGDDADDAREVNSRPSKRLKTGKRMAHGGLQGSLLLAAAQQVDPVAATTGRDDDNDSSDGESGAGTPRTLFRRNAQLSTLSRELTIDELRVHFGKPIVEVAKEFGICTTFLKKICRRCGIKRWPHRQIRSLNRTIEMLQQAEANATSMQEKQKYATQIAQIEAKKRAVIEDPDANGKLERVKKSVINRASSPNTRKSEAPRDIPIARTGSPLLAGTPADFLHAVAAIAASEAEKMQGKFSDLAPSKPQVDTTVGASLDRPIGSAEGVLPATTPTSSSVDVLSGDMRISPSHRKLMTGPKVGDAPGAVRGAKLGVLQEEEDLPSPTDTVGAPIAPVGTA